MTQAELLIRLNLIVDLGKANMPSFVLKNEVQRLITDISGEKVLIASKIPDVVYAPAEPAHYIE